MCSDLALHVPAARLELLQMNWWSIVAFIAGQAGSGMLFKMASESQGWRWGAWFTAANLVGFICAVALPQALKGQNPNTVFSICIGGGFCALQLSSCLLFKSALQPIQWLGAGAILGGILMVSLGAKG